MIEILSAEPSLLEKINTIATHYSRESQLEKAKEELNELMDELENAININGYVSLSGNTWSEVARCQYHDCPINYTESSKRYRYRADEI